MRISIVTIESAINHWRSQNPSSAEDPVVCPEVRVLADVYAHLIFNKASDIDAADLTDSQRQAIDGAPPVENQ